MAVLSICIVVSKCITALDFRSGDTLVPEPQSFRTETKETQFANTSNIL